MFLITATHRPISPPSGFDVQSSRAGEMIVCFSTDSFLSRITRENGSMRLIESPLIDTANVEKSLFLDVRLDADSRQIAMEKKLGSGRPVYYHLSSEGEFFCASHVSLLRAAGVVIDVNESTLPEYAVYRYVAGPHTLFRDVHRLLAGYTLKVDCTAGRAEIAASLPFTPPEAGASRSSTDYWTHLLELLTDSIRCFEPRADQVIVPLSGGVDSTILFRICQQQFGVSESHSASFPPELLVSETENRYAMSAAEALGVRHSIYSTDLLRYLENTLRALAATEEPLGQVGSGMVRGFFDEGMPKTRTLILSGQGAGKIYTDGKVVSYARASRFPWSILTSTPLSYLLYGAACVTGRGKGFAAAVRRGDFRRHALDSPANPLWRIHRYTDLRWTLRLFDVQAEDVIRSRAKLLEPYRDRSTLDLFALVDFWLEGEFVQSVWSKVAESLQRTMVYPFSGEALVRYLYSIPWEARSHKNKILLERAGLHIGVPEFIFSRKKAGFNVERPAWAMPGGPLDALIPLSKKHLSPSTIAELRSEDPYRAMSFWAMLNYALWRRLHIDREPLEDLITELRDAYAATANR